MPLKTSIQFTDVAFWNRDSLIIDGNAIPEVFKKNDFFRDAHRGDLRDFGYVHFDDDLSN